MPAVGAATFWMSDHAPVEPLRARRMPLFLAAVGFASGILLARNWQEPAFLVLALLLLFGLTAISLRYTPLTSWLALFALWAATGCWCAQIQPPVSRQSALAPFADGLSRDLRGEVLAVHPLAPTEVNPSSPMAPSQPWQVEPGGWEGESTPSGASLDLAVDAVEQLTPDLSTMVPISGGVRVSIYGAVPEIHCGDRLQLPVRLSTPEVYRDPGAFSYTDWLLGQGISLLGSGKAPRLQVLSHSRGTLTCRLATAQHWAASRLQALPKTPLLTHLPVPIRFTPTDAAMMAAMLFGDRAALTADLRAGFERTGTFHLFVVSGLHIALFTGALFWLIRRFRIPEVPAVGLTLFFGFGYALLTGFGVPAQRAFAMAAVYLIARALDRQSSGWNALGAASLLILCHDPRALYEPSFQMTALVILAVTGLGIPASDRLLQGWTAVHNRLEVLELDAYLHPVTAARRVRLRLWSALCRDLTGSRLAARLPALLTRAAVLISEAIVISAAIELCMALPMAFYFHRAVPLAMPGNLLVAPLAMLLVGAGVVTFLGGLLSPWLAVLPATLTALLLHFVRAVVDRLGHASLGDLRVPAPPAVAIVLFGLLLAFAAWALRSRKGLLACAGALASLLLLPAVLWPVRPTLHPGTLEVTALDVGQGDSLLVVSPEGRTLLVDAGGPIGNLKVHWDVGENVVAPYLWSRRIRRLDAVLISHGHSDHIGGMPAILRDLHPRELWLSITPGDAAGLKGLLAQARAQGITIRSFAAGDQFPWGGATATVLAPEPGYGNPGDARNDDSLVMRLDWQKASVLLEGDAEAPSEAAMVAHNRLAPVALLKVGHHGSKTSTNPDFLAAVAPRAAVISDGKHNTFGHPRMEVLERLEAAHVHTFRTDRVGVQSFFLHPDGSIECFEPAYP